MPNKKSPIVMTALILLSILLIAPIVRAESPSKMVAGDETYRQYMLKVTRQLGTTCVTCHNLSNFASSEKIAFKVAKEHIHITQVLIDSGFDGQNNKPKVDCYMCHRGKLIPDYKEPFDPLTMKKIKK